MKTWIGTSGFQYPEWKGKFYPATMPAAKMLAYYSERFSTTEVNYTFPEHSFRSCAFAMVGGDS
jgi:uncharacterized protein YecE (DUF72 family)